MYYHVIASGSKGNATIVANKTTRILIDMGISFCRLEEGLKEINLTVDDIDAAIFTHNHTDHIAGIKFLSPKKMYALEGTLPSSLSNVVNPYEPFKIKDIVITPFCTSHDAINPCGYKLEDDEETLVYVTDTGVFPMISIDLIRNPNYLIIESNHDIQMLMNTNRPYELKERIMSDHGHLCNEDSAIAAKDIIGDKTKELILAHLSEEANTPGVALKAYEEIFSHFGVDTSNLEIKCANQWASISGGKR